MGCFNPKTGRAFCLAGKTFAYGRLVRSLKDLKGERAGGREGGKKRKRKRERERVSIFLSLFQVI